MPTVGQKIVRDGKLYLIVAIYKTSYGAKHFLDNRPDLFYSVFSRRLLKRYLILKEC